MKLRNSLASVLMMVLILGVYFCGQMHFEKENSRLSIKKSPESAEALKCMECYALEYE